MSLKILVVEDNADNREMMMILLKFQGFAVVTAADGREGLYLAAAEYPDLIITDLNMPHLDGVGMIKLMRQDRLLKTTPILALAAYGEDEAAMAIKTGADQAMTKPIDFDSLMNRIKDLTGSGD